jgi:hypothetical protein
MSRILKSFNDNVVCNLIRELSKAIDGSQPQKARHLLRELRKLGFDYRCNDTAVLDEAIEQRK